MSRPWMPLYIADYLADTRRLSMAEHGAYILLIMEYWRNGGLPDDERRLARIVGASQEEWQSVRDAIADLFLPGWKHKRIDEELARAAAKSDAARDAANLKWEKERERNAAAHADAQQSQCERICETDANSMLSQPQSQPLSNSDSSSLRSDSAQEAKPAKRDPRGERLPEDWEPIDPGRAVEILGDRASAELDKFRDYWRAKPGKDGRKLDWEATWRNWLRTAAERANSRAPPSHGGGFAKIHAQFTGKPYE